MHITEVKLMVNELLKNKGFTVYSNVQERGDYRLHFYEETKRFSLTCKSSRLEKVFTVIAREVQELLGLDSMQLKTHVVAYTSDRWEVDAVPVLAHAGNGTAARAVKEVPRTPAIAFERQQPVPERETVAAELLQSNVARLGLLADRLETTLDEFRMNRLMLREALGQIYDYLKEQGMDCYNTKAPIQLNEGRLAIPHLTRDEFIAIGMLGVRKAKEKE